MWPRKRGQKAFSRNQTPLGFCDGLHRPFINFYGEEESGCGLPKYNTTYLPFCISHRFVASGNIHEVKKFIKFGKEFLEMSDPMDR